MRSICTCILMLALVWLQTCCVQAQSCFFPGDNARWQPRFVANGYAQTSRISAMVAKPDGLYCLFENPNGANLLGGNRPASAVNKWNGSYWEPVGPAFPNTGTAVLRCMVADSEGNLVIGGSFTTNATLNSPCLVKLNLQTLSYEPLGMGITSTGAQSHLQKLAIYKDTLYVLGRFNQVADADKTMPVKNIARFYLHTNRWDSLGGGISDFIQHYADVNSIPLCGLDVSPEGEVFVAGDFNTIASISNYNGVASWKTNRGWKKLGTGVQYWNGSTPSRGIPYALSYNPADSGLYIGGYVGYLQNASPVNYRKNGIARYRDSVWTYHHGQYTASIELTCFDSLTQSVYYEGAFGKASIRGLADANMIAQFTTASDSLVQLSNGITSGTHLVAMARWNNKLYVSGFFNEADSIVKAFNLAAWNGQQWEPVGGGMDQLNAANILKTWHINPQGQLLAGGSFATSGGRQCNGWGVLDSNIRFSPVDAGLQTSSSTILVNAIVSPTDSTYLLGGRFQKNGAIGITGYNRNTQTWFKAGNSGLATIYQYINTLVVFNGTIVAGGSFTSIDGVNAANLAYWDGSQWHAMGDPDGEVTHLSVLGDSVLYVSGTFQTINGVSAKYLARYTQGTWTQVGAGLYAQPGCIAVHPVTSELWIAASGSVPNLSGPSYNANGYAVWDGLTWKGYGTFSGFVSNVNAIYHHTDSTTYLTASGLTSINGKTTGNVVRYHPVYGWAGTGGNLLRTSSPYTPLFHALAVYRNHLLVGGQFDLSGDSIQSFNMAAYALDNPAEASAWVSLGNDTTAYYGVSITAATGSYDSLVWSHGTRNTTGVNLLTTGTYTATAFHKGCVASDTITVTILGDNIYKGGKQDGAGTSGAFQHRTMAGGKGLGASQAAYVMHGIMPGGKGPAFAADVITQQVFLAGGSGDGGSQAEVLQHKKLPGGRGIGAFSGQATDGRTVFRGGPGNGSASWLYLALPDGEIRRVSAPLSFTGKDSVALKAWLHNNGTFPVYGFRVSWFVKGNLYTTQVFAGDSILPADSMEVTMSKRFIPQVGELPLDVCVLVSEIPKEQDTLNNRFCYILDKSTAVNEFDASRLDIRVFPNPASDEVWFALDGLNEQAGQLELFNAEGRAVLTRNIAKGTPTFGINTRQLPSGIYPFLLKSGTGTLTGKLVIVH